MKKADKSAKTDRDLEMLVSKLSENDILNPQAMSNVKGGDGEGNGGEVVITIPKQL